MLFVRVEVDRSVRDYLVQYKLCMKRMISKPELDAYTHRLKDNVFAKLLEQHFSGFGGSGVHGLEVR